MSKINSRQKGARGERQLAKKLSEYGYECKRGVQYQGSPDSPDVTGLAGIHIECKCVERLNIHDAMEQSKRDAGESEIPVVMHKRNYTEWLCTMRLEDFMKIYSVWQKESEDKTNE